MTRGVVAAQRCYGKNALLNPWQQTLIMEQSGWQNCLRGTSYSNSRLGRKKKNIMQIKSCSKAENEYSVEKSACNAYRQQKVQGTPGLGWHHIPTVGAFNLSELESQGQVIRHVFLQLLPPSKCSINFELFVGNVFS